MGLAIAMAKAVAMARGKAMSETMAVFLLPPYHFQERLPNPRPKQVWGSKRHGWGYAKKMRNAIWSRTVRVSCRDLFYEAVS